ncbi:hypothetical protein COJ91_17040 [Bacillus thuringiensis]|nr:hypothetical protein COJ91_17040 [Bacillus thuringiensis]PGP55202.1 hypothetical protein CN992_07815 [Bacillus thuringiensis]PGY51926.1 hypothetical protein COE24_29325 [Bacillus thuringiensis]
MLYSVIIETEGDISLVSPAESLIIGGLDRERNRCIPRSSSFYHKFIRSHPLIKTIFGGTGYKNNQSVILFEEVRSKFGSIIEIVVEKLYVNDREWLKKLNRGD